MSETLNLARLKKGSEVFEIVVDPDKAILARHGKIPVSDALMYPKIYSDAKKGMLASEQRMEALFNTEDPVKVAEQIIKHGELQVTTEYRKKLAEQKRRQIVEIIRRNGVDPKTHLPHPAQRIESAIDEAKARIDEYRPAEQQVQEILRQLRPIIPIKFEIKEIEIIIPANYSGKAYNIVRNFGKILSEKWQNDGSWKGIVEIPGGMESELYDRLNSITRGETAAKVLKTR